MRVVGWVLACVLLAGCRQEKAEPDRVLEPAALTDSILYAQATAPSGWVWYQRDSSRRRSVRASGHLPYQRVRYNAIAAAALKDGGKLPVGEAFPAGSLIVKELFTDSTGSGTWELIAVMKKEPANPLAANGWVWGEYLPELTADYIRLDGRGAACVPCHSQAQNRDLARVFDAR